MFYVFFFLITKAAALDSATPIIEQAHAHALKKNRQEACAILQKAATATPSAKVRAKLTESLGQIAKVFFTDKAQKAYESAQSSIWENPDIALTQLRLALELEDGNILIQGSIARVQLLKSDCEGALTTAQAAQKVDPFDADSAALELRALACLQRSESLRERAKALPMMDKWQESFVQYVLALDSLAQKSWRKTYDVALKLTEEQPGFSEGYFLLNKAGAELNRDVEPALQKYVSLCKALTIRERKRYSLEHRLCTGLKEAEVELAKSATDP